MKQGWVVLGVVVAAIAGWFAWTYYWRVEMPILVGIVHSRSGPLKISEESMIQAELLAIEEINKQGGLLGRQIKPVVADGRSDPKVFAQEAQRLIETDKVCVIFGGWSSPSRRSMKAVVEASDHLLFFPSNYEGMDISPNVVCTGPIPNQQVIPAVNWCYETLKARKFFLASSVDIQAYASNELIKDQLKALGAQLVGEKYISLDGTTGVPEMISAIKAAGADVILSTVIGDGNKPFYEQLARNGLNPEQLPVLSFTIGEDELSGLPVQQMVGDYAAWSYFQAIDNPVNKAFVERFRARYGPERRTSDSIVAAYNSVKLWAQAVEESGTEQTTEVRRAIRRQSLQAPEGVVSIDAETLHAWRPFHLGRIRGDGQFDILWSLEKPVRPVPYPFMRSRADWNTFVERLHAAWNRGDFNPLTFQGTSGPGTRLPGRSSNNRPRAAASGVRGARSTLR